MKTLLHINQELDCPVTLDQEERGTFQVRYGQQVKAGLSYDEAASELGYCVLHSLGCKGALNDATVMS